jgi:dephospho-CoA kinase
MQSGGPGSAGPRVVVGVAGGYCAGKNALVGVLESWGFVAVDVDAVGHQVLKEPQTRDRVIGEFGPGIEAEGGEIDRRALAARVFGNREALSLLESIVHPRMVARVEEQLRRCGNRVVINAAVLFRMGLDRLCDFVMCVQAPLLKRLSRARRRDHLGLLAALRRLASQRGICPKSNDPAVDTYYVGNSRGLEWLEGQAARILTQRGIEVR